MLLRRVPIALSRERRERFDQPWTRVAGVDDVVQVAARCGLVGMRELVAVFVRLLLGRLVLIEDLDRAFRPHDRDLGGGPSDVVVAAHVLPGHYLVSAALRLARGDPELRGPGLAVGVRQL